MKLNSWEDASKAYLEEMDGAKKIGVLTDTAETTAGIGRVARNLAKKFVEKDKEVILYTLEGKISREKRKELEKIDIEVKELQRNPSIDPREIIRIKNVLEEDQLDYINSHGFYLPLAAALSDVKTLKTYHAHITVCSEFIKHPLNWIKWVVEEAPSIWLADKRVSISDYAARQMKRFYLSSSKVIHNGIDKEKFKEKETDYRSKIGIPEEAYVVGSLSALKKYKNQQKTLEIFAEEHSHKENNYLVIGGDGPRRKHLEKKASELGIRGKTKFLGYVPDDEIVDFYNSIDLFIYPSKWEGFGLPPREAYLCGSSIKITEKKTALGEIN